MPPAYCTSRWLARYVAFMDRLQHIAALRDFYKNPPPPTPCKNSSAVSAPLDAAGSANSSDDDGDDDDNDDEANLRSNSSNRLQILKRAFNDANIAMTELELLVYINCFQPGHEFVLAFQSKSVKIHELYTTLMKMMRNTMIVVCETSGLNTADGRQHDGK